MGLDILCYFKISHDEVFNRLLMKSIFFVFLLFNFSLFEEMMYNCITAHFSVLTCLLQFATYVNTKGRCKVEVSVLFIIRARVP